MKAWKKTKPKHSLCILLLFFRSNKVRSMLVTHSTKAPAVSESNKAEVWGRRPTEVRGQSPRRCGDFTTFFQKYAFLVKLDFTRFYSFFPKIRLFRLYVLVKLEQTMEIYIILIYQDIIFIAIILVLEPAMLVFILLTPFIAVSFLIFV